MTTVNEVLSFMGVKPGDKVDFGVPGMKWGRRRSREELKSARSADAVKTADLRTKAKDTKVASLSNQELQQVITRLNLERQFVSTVNQNSPGKRFVKNLLGDSGAQQLAMDSYFDTKLKSLGDEPDPVRVTRIGKQKTVTEAVVRSTRPKKKN